MRHTWGLERRFPVILIRGSSFSRGSHVEERLYAMSLRLQTARTACQIGRLLHCDNSHNRGRGGLSEWQHVGHL